MDLLCSVCMGKYWREFSDRYSPKRGLCIKFIHVSVEYI